MTYQIVGGDGRVLGADDAELLSLTNSYNRGALAPDAYVGAAGPLLSIPMAGLPGGGSARTASASPAVMRAMVDAMTRAQSAGNLRLNIQPQPGLAMARPGPMREVVQGLVSAAAIAAGGNGDITFNVTMEFRPTRLMIGESVKSLFVVNDIKVGNDSLFLQTGPVPGECFGLASGFSSALKRRSASPGTPVTISVTNIDGAAHTFRGAIFGEGVDLAQCAT